jgi:choice-of-anchor A domain-containing protein/uncharacterized repeat protein (TIGR01451 family)
MACSSPNLGAASAFNVFVFGNHTQSNTDAGGRIAVGGNATYTNYSVSSGITPLPAPGSLDTLIVGGSMNITNAQNYAGNSVISPSGTVIKYTMTNPNVTLPQPVVGDRIDFAAAETYLNNASLVWGALMPNGQVVLSYCTLFLIGTDPDLNVFTFDGADINGSGSRLDTICGLVINAPLSSTVLVNINGVNVGFGSYQMFRNNDNSQFPQAGSSATPQQAQLILFNFPQATSWFSQSIGIEGSVLAPFANLSTGYGHIDGSIIGLSLSGSIEEENYLFQGCLPSPTPSCNCVPYSNICCCGPLSGISAVQPACQVLPDGSVVNNPAFSASLGKSYWSYKFMTDCANTTEPISNLAIAVCVSISSSSVVVSERIDGCGAFVPVPFTLTTSDPNFGLAPSGFQWLIVVNSGRYGNGVAVEYRIEIVGDYPTATQPIEVLAGINVLVFNCNCFLVPMCNPQGKLTISKTCGSNIVNNQAVLTYQVNVSNTGNASLTNVQFNDTVNIPQQLTLGAIVVTPATLTVDTSTPATVKISGNLGTIDPGGVAPITYTISITNVTVPGSYVSTNTATASATGTQASASCSNSLAVVKIALAKCCSISGSQFAFTVSASSVGLSPSVLINGSDTMVIPAGVTIQVMQFTGFTAVYSGTSIPIPVNTNITGPVSIDFTITNVLIPAGGSVQQSVGNLLVSSAVVGTSPVLNTITSVAPVNPGNQVFLGASPLPVSATINVTLGMACSNPC